MTKHRGDYLDPPLAGSNSREVCCDIPHPSERSEQSLWQRRPFETSEPMCIIHDRRWTQNAQNSSYGNYLSYTCGTNCRLYFRDAYGNPTGRWTLACIFHPVPAARYDRVPSNGHSTTGPHTRVGATRVTRLRHIRAIISLKSWRSFEELELKWSLEKFGVKSWNCPILSICLVVLEWILSGQNLLEQSGLPTTQQLVEKIEDFILFYTHDLDKTIKIARFCWLRVCRKEWSWYLHRGSSFAKLYWLWRSKRSF